MKMRKREVVVGVGGSIAAYKACDVVSRLVKENCNVNVVMTREAEQFVTPLTFQTVSNNPVVTDLFKSPEEWSPLHISLARRAELVLIVPATANLISKLACGICDDALTCLVVSTGARVVICPAMNESMYKNKIIQGNISRLKSLGYIFVGPVKGRLACGETGLGHIADVETIVKEAKKLLSGR